MTCSRLRVSATTFELGHGDRHVVEEPLVVDLDDVAADLADEPRHAREQAGLVADLDAEAREPALARESAHEDRGEHARIDVAAHTPHPNPPPQGQGNRIW